MFQQKAEVSKSEKETKIEVQIYFLTLQMQRRENL